jgi:hypothetical protein
VGPLAGPAWSFAGPSARAKERASERGWAAQGARSAGPNREKKGESVRTAGFVFLFFKKIVNSNSFCLFQ